MTQSLFYAICAGIGIIFPTILYPFWVKNKTKQMPTSYSQSYSLLEKMFNMGYIFTGWVGSHLLLLLPGLLYCAKDKIQFALPFVALAALLVVGIKPSGIKSSITKIHCLAAQICAILSTINVGLHGYWETALIVLGVLFIWSKLFQRKYETLIMEFGAFLIAYLTVIFSYFGF